MSEELDYPKWSIKSASNSFSQVFSAALRVPQLITRRGDVGAVLVEADRFAELEEKAAMAFTEPDIFDEMRKTPVTDPRYRLKAPYPRRNLG